MFVHVTFVTRYCCGGLGGDRFPLQLKASMYSGWVCYEEAERWLLMEHLTQKIDQTNRVFRLCKDKLFACTYILQSLSLLPKYLSPGNKKQKCEPQVDKFFTPYWLWCLPGTEEYDDDGLQLGSKSFGYIWIFFENFFRCCNDEENLLRNIF